MELEKIIDKYFSRDMIISNICKYQLYYQIGLGSLAYESMQDLEETLDKLDQLDLHIDSQRVFVSIYEIILHFGYNDDFDESFETYLKATALSQMLKDFIEADKELINPQPFEDMMIEKIKDDIFFTGKMQQQFDEDYKALLPSWKMTISADVANEIKNSIVDMYNKGIG